MACVKPRFHWRSGKGFSLIELAMVLVAAGLMVGMANQVMTTKTVSTTDNDAAIKQCYATTRAAMTSMNNALQQFFLKNGYYPLPAPNDGSSGTQVTYQANAANYTKITVDNVASPSVAIGYFPYTTVGLPPQYQKDCFATSGVKIASYTHAADSYYRYMVSLDSAPNDSPPTNANYKSHTHHGAIVINASTTASMKNNAIYAIISHGSTGCSAITQTIINSCASSPSGPLCAKAMNCAASNIGLAHAAFSRSAGDPKFFDDLVFYFIGKDNGCNGSASWPNATTGPCSSNVGALKPGVTITASSTATGTIGTATVTCQSTGSTTYTLSANGTCTCSTGYTLVSGVCQQIVNGSCGTAAGTCATGTVTGDNNDTNCGDNRSWTCQGAYGGTNASCSITNPNCVCSNGATNYPTCSICSDNGGLTQTISANCPAGDTGTATQLQTRASCSTAWVNSGSPNTSGCTAPKYTGTWTPGTCSCTTSTYPASACSGGNGQCSGADPYVGTPCTPTGCAAPTGICPSYALHSYTVGNCTYCIDGSDEVPVAGFPCGNVDEVDVYYTSPGQEIGSGYKCPANGDTANIFNASDVAIPCPSAPYTGTWIAGSCPTACGQPATSVAATCSTGNPADCAPGLQPTATSCPATAACGQSCQVLNIFSNPPSTIIIPSDTQYIAHWYSSTSCATIICCNGQDYIQTTSTICPASEPGWVTGPASDWEVPTTACASLYSSPPTYTGTWTAGVCSTACGQPATSVAATCSNSNCDPSQQPAATSCAATASCYTGTWTHGTCSCTTSTYPASTCSGGNGQCSGSDPYVGTPCTPTGCPVNGTCSTSPSTCTYGTATDNGNTTCNQTRSWTCAGSNGGSPSGTCSSANAACTYTGTWTPGTCSSFCGAGTYGASTCTGGNGMCSGSDPYVGTSCTTTAGTPNIFGACTYCSLGTTDSVVSDPANGHTCTVANETTIFYTATGQLVSFGYVCGTDYAHAFKNNGSLISCAAPPTNCTYTNPQTGVSTILGNGDSITFGGAGCSTYNCCGGTITTTTPKTCPTTNQLGTATCG